MVDKPLFTVLMPTHSRIDVIGHAIQSVLDQTRPDFELLVVGDGCVAGTGDVVAGFGDPRIRFFDLPKAPYFGYANRNIALREARGGLIGFAADDDLLFPDHLETLERGLAGGAALAYSQALWVSTDAIAAPFLTNLEMADELHVFMNQTNSIAASCFLYRANALPSLEAWPENVPTAADLLLWRRIIDTNPRSPLAYCRTPTVLHFSATWKESRFSNMPQLKSLLEIADHASWWPAVLRPVVASGQTEQEVFASHMRNDPGWTTEVRRAAADVAARIAWDEARHREPPMVRDLTVNLVARERQVKELTARLDSVEQAEAASRNVVRDIQNSTSWRITAPLRALADSARRLLRRTRVQDRPTDRRRPTVAACLIAKNEGRYLAEWLAYHLLLGFDEILVYDNDSRDDTAAIVRRASANDRRIRHILWPDVPGEAPQVPAYNKALRQTRADWIAFIDADEFLVLKEHDTIGDFLEGFDADTGAVCINWLLFGSSGHENYIDDLAIRRFTRCAEPTYSLNEIVKSIVRRTAVKHMHVHAPVLVRGHYYSSDGRVIDLRGFFRAHEIVHHRAQINHYVVKSNEEYRNKVSRGRAGKAPDAPDRSAKFTDEFRLSRDRNETVDYAIAPMIPRVEKEIRRLMANDASGRAPEELRLRDA